MELWEHIKRQQYPVLPPPPIPVTPIVTKQLNMFEQSGWMYQDLYPRSPYDSNLWIELFIIADKASPEIAKRLEFVRTVGANLILDNTYGFIIKPIIDATGTNGWTTIEQYNTERQCLEPYYKEITAALKELRHLYNTGQIGT